MPSSSEDIQAAFAFLLKEGYALAATSITGAAGTIAYRSPHLWLSVEWDRWDPWLTVTFMDVGPDPVLWTDVDRAFTGRTHPEFGPNDLPEAPIATLVAFVKESIPSIEARLRSSDPSALAIARQLEASHRQELDEIRARRRFR